MAASDPRNTVGPARVVQATVEMGRRVPRPLETPREVVAPVGAPERASPRVARPYAPATTDTVAHRLVAIDGVAREETPPVAPLKMATVAI